MMPPSVAAKTAKKPCLEDKERMHTDTHNSVAQTIPYSKCVILSDWPLTSPIRYIVVSGYVTELH